MMGVATPKNANWRLVCHECGHKWPPNTAIPVSKAGCCSSKSTIKIHVHNIDKPCELCADDYECKGCRDFADNFSPRTYPTAEEPFHPDCPYHKEKSE